MLALAKGTYTRIMRTYDKYTHITEKRVHVNGTRPRSSYIAKSLYVQYLPFLALQL